MHTRFWRKVCAGQTAKHPSVGVSSGIYYLMLNYFMNSEIETSLMATANRVSYQQVKGMVLSSIRNNTWPPGSIIPGEIELAEQFGCARATVNRAMRELAEDGIVERKRKAGTMVKPSPTPRAKFDIPVIREEIEKTGSAYRYALVRRSKTKSPDWLRAKLNLSSDDQVLQTQCMHFRDNKPYQFEDRWINLTAVPAAGNTEFKTMSPNEWLLREVPFTNAEITFSASRATKSLSDFLDCSEGDALFSIERTTWLGDMTVTFARLHFSPGYSVTTQL